MSTGNEFRDRRLATQERARRTRQDRARNTVLREQRLAELEAEVRAGRRVPAPSRITCALDLRSLYGPQVDADLGVLEDPPVVVDEWEAGLRVPSWEEVGRLAELTDMLPEWFYGPELPEPSYAFVCRR